MRGLGGGSLDVIEVWVDEEDRKGNIWGKMDEIL
jgi:hypothetical protein